MQPLQSADAGRLTYGTGEHHAPPPAAAASTLNYEPVVPFWISKEALEKKAACTVVEVEAHGVKVLLIINDKGEVKVSVWPTHMPFSRLVAMILLD